MFNGFDIDHDGIISRKNFMEASRDVVPSLSAAEVLKCFDTLLETFNLVASVSNHQKKFNSEAAPAGVDGAANDDEALASASPRKRGLSK